MQNVFFFEDLKGNLMKNCTGYSFLDTIERGSDKIKDIYKEDPKGK